MGKMTQNEFVDRARMHLDTLMQTLEEKGQTYSNEEAFANFEQAAVVLGISKEEYLLTLVVKHMLALLGIARGNVEQDYDGVGSRTDDIIIYMLLLRAMYWKSSFYGTDRSGGD